MNPAPRWPRQPDLQELKAIALRHLPNELEILDAAFLEVRFFTEGATNRIYAITYAGQELQYLLRVAAPVDPYFKTGSEVATYAFLRQHTTIPVPKIIAWDSSTSCGLGFEWILIEKVKGVELAAVWRHITWDQKVALTKRIAITVAELQTHPFPTIGSLFLVKEKICLDGAPSLGKCKVTKLENGLLHEDTVIEEFLPNIDEFSSLSRTLSIEIMSSQLPLEIYEDNGAAKGLDMRQDRLEKFQSKCLSQDIAANPTGATGHRSKKQASKITAESIREASQSEITLCKTENDTAFEGCDDQQREDSFQGSYSASHDPNKVQASAELIMENSLEAELVAPEDYELQDLSLFSEDSESTEQSFLTEGSQDSILTRLSRETMESDSSLALAFKDDLLKKLFYAPLSATSSTPAVIHRPVSTYSIGDHTDGRFVIGRTVDRNFYVERRLHIAANRGPYSSSLSWLRSKLEMQINWIKQGLAIRETECYDKDDSEFGDLDDEFEENAPEMEDVCHRFFKVLAAVFPEDENDQTFTLRHHDLNLRNIFVNPDTLAITGIIDWEMINAVPRWEASKYPAFLSVLNLPFEPEDEPPMPASYEDPDDPEVEERDQWDNKILRQHYTAATQQAMRELGCTQSNQDDPVTIERKREVDNIIVDLVEYWEAARTRVGKYEQELGLRTQTNGEADMESEAQPETEGAFMAETKMIDQLDGAVADKDGSEDGQQEGTMDGQQEGTMDEAGG